MLINKQGTSKEPEVNRSVVPIRTQLTKVPEPALQTTSESGNKMVAPMACHTNKTYSKTTMDKGLDNCEHGDCVMLYPHRMKQECASLAVTADFDAIRAWCQTETVPGPQLD